MYVCTSVLYNEARNKHLIYNRVYVIRTKQVSNFYFKPPNIRRNQWPAKFKMSTSKIAE
jgi:hypothetical protein